MYEALQMIHTFLYICTMARKPNCVLNIMYFHTITMFHDVILEHTEEIAKTRVIPC